MKEVFEEAGNEFISESKGWFSKGGDGELRGMREVRGVRGVELNTEKRGEFGFVVSFAVIVVLLRNE
jgi:hypothetical protein